MEHLRLYHLKPCQVRIVCYSVLIILANPGGGLPDEPKGQPGQDCWLLQPPTLLPDQVNIEQMAMEL